MLVGGWDGGAVWISGWWGGWRRECIRGVMVRVTSDEKSLFVGNRPGMVAAEVGLLCCAWWVTP